MIHRALIAALCWLLAWQPVWADCTLDTHTNVVSGLGSTTWTINVSTNFTNEMLVAPVAWLRQSGETITSVTSPHLTWTDRTGRMSTGSSHCDIGGGNFGDCSLAEYIWTAFAPSALSNETVTITFSSAPVSFQGAAVAAFTGATGAYDSNGSLPAILTTFPGTPSPPAGGPVSVSTSHANDMVITSCLVGQGGPHAAGCGVGITGAGTLVPSTNYFDAFGAWFCAINFGGSMCANMYYRKVSATLSSSSEYAGAPNNGQAYIQTGDAFAISCGPTVVLPQVWINE